MTFSKMVAVGAVVCGAVACSQPVDESTAPMVDDDVIAPADEGTSYNGWSQVLTLDIWPFAQYGEWSHALYRSYGDTTRGGGACTVRGTGAYCTSDSDCMTAATNVYGSQAWGYCYQNACYSRPGSQQDNCLLGPSRGANSYFSGPPTQNFNYSTDAVLGCMTKTAGTNGFNTACGCTAATCGSNYTSLYMRTVTFPTIHSCSGVPDCDIN